jgi:hypothetical protein
MTSLEQELMHELRGLVALRQELAQELERLGQQQHVIRRAQSIITRQYEALQTYLFTCGANVVAEVAQVCQVGDTLPARPVAPGE